MIDFGRTPEIHTGTEPHFVFLAQKMPELFVQFFKQSNRRNRIIGVFYRISLIFLRRKIIE